VNAAVRDGIALEYDGFGNPSDPPLLLVMGLGFQLIHWDPEFCQASTGAGWGAKCPERAARGSG